MKSVEFVPLNVPISRRLETLAIFIWTMLLPSFALLLLLATMHYPYPMLLYFLYAIFDETPERGGRVVVAARTAGLWVLMRNYFPVSLVKTSELDAAPGQKYIFGYHP